MIERFIRGLAVGSMVGAIFAGWFIARRRGRPDVRQSTTFDEQIAPGSSSHEP